MAALIQDLEGPMEIAADAMFQEMRLSNKRIIIRVTNKDEEEPAILEGNIITTTATVQKKLNRMYFEIKIQTDIPGVVLNCKFDGNVKNVNIAEDRGEMTISDTSGMNNRTIRIMWGTIEENIRIGV